MKCEQEHAPKFKASEFNVWRWELRFLKCKYLFFISSCMMSVQKMKSCIIEGEGFTLKQASFEIEVILESKNVV